ncbi:MAG: alpha/beta hydrolase family protein [Deltaproteobacteria bacterium]|nr:alpha/beta hydrolase family protein [Deltaproteobacteria bacterium]MBW2696199.1 alpha/beta hydrolase family protein [Deltaproteobacteria bacterium]
MNCHTPSIPDLPRASLPREGWGGRLRTGLGTTLDSAILGAARIVVERALIPDPKDVDELRASARALLEEDLHTDPKRYFTFLGEPLVPLAESKEPRRGLPGGRVIARTLTSEYRPYPYAQPDACHHVTNRDSIRLEHWVHEGGARGTLVALHGFAMGRPRVDALALFASQWFELGLDVVLLTLPHHGDRTPPNARFSGEWFAVPNVMRLGEAVREAIYETHVVTSWLRSRDAGPVGLLGLSLGGYLSALSAGLMEDLDFVIPIVPPACMGDLAWRFFERTSHARSGGDDPLTQDELRSAFRVHSPLAHPLRVPARRILIVAGRGDRVVPPEHPTALWRHWGEPAIHWFSGSHIAPFGRRGVVDAVAQHLRALGVL